MHAPRALGLNDRLIRPELSMPSYVVTGAARGIGVRLVASSDSDYVRIALTDIICSTSLSASSSVHTTSGCTMII